MKLINREVALGLDLIQALTVAFKGQPTQAYKLALFLEESEDFVQKVLNRLKKHGYVTPKRGPGGGFTVAEGALDQPLASLINQFGKSLAVHRWIPGASSNKAIGGLQIHLERTKIRSIL